jgi:hypothetical protein
MERGRCLAMKAIGLPRRLTDATRSRCRFHLASCGQSFSSSMPNLVKIFGERNCGTNALGYLIRANSSSPILPSSEFEIDPAMAARAWVMGPRDREQIIDRIYASVPEILSWKHCATNFSNARIFGGAVVLVCVRHPASWLVGLYKNPYHTLGGKPATIEEFIRQEWETVERERLGGRSFRPLQLYNLKLASHLAFAEDLRNAGIAATVVRHEDLLFRPKEVFRSIGTNLADVRKRFRPRLTSTKRRAQPGDICREQPSTRMGKPVFLLRRYYAKELWRRPLRGLEGIVNAEVDWDVAHEFGYSRL